MGVSVEIICYGGTVISPSITIDDTNRKGYFELLMALYRTERKYIDTRRSEGISSSAKKGNYKGRKRIKIDKLASQEIFLDYEANRINSTEAAKKLEISKSTFLRRYRDYKKLSQ